jgi:GntR family transcriptional regulator/MocR family aminotransferase
MHLDLDGDGTLHAQLTRALRHAVLERGLAAGTRLPATRELAAGLGVSRNTVVSAYEQLTAEGYIEGHAGSGNYVAALPRPTAKAVRPGAPLRAPRLTTCARVATEQRANRPPGRKLASLRYNLEYGLPLVTPALTSMWRRALARAAEDTDPDYPPAEGLLVLRAAIAGYLGRRRGLMVEADDVIVTAGVQQAIDLVVRALVAPGDGAAIEDPHYQGTRQVLMAAGARLSFVPVDGDGIEVEKLPATGVRLVCVTPSHQFPRGVVLSLRRRLELLAWASKADAWIVEDDYDGEFRHDGRPIAALKSLDREDRVIYVGSFSKVLFPALRLGYLVVPPTLREPLRATKWLADRGCPAIEQHALAMLVESGRFERLLRRSGRLLAERRRALLEGLARHAAGLVEVEGTSAGMHVAVWLPRHRPADVAGVIAAAQAAGVGVYPIAPYFSRPPRRAGLLLGYSGRAARDVAEAARRLGAVLRQTASA